MSNDPANPPDKLPEDMWKYFNHVPGTIEVPLSKLSPIRARPTGIANAKKYMWQAFLGVNKKRDPLSLRDLGGGQYEVADGNSTYANAVESGWKTIPGVVVEAEKTASDKEAAGLKYVGIFFTPSEMAEILRWWRSEVGIPFHPERSRNPHVTTAFNPTQAFVDSQPLGKRVRLKITMWAADDLGQAVMVTGYPTRADYPHLTISHDPSVKAYYSNTLLSDLDSRHVVSGPTIEGVLGYFDGEKIVTTPTLRSDVIRLAHANPDLRPYLLPLLKSASDYVLKFSLTVSGVTGIGMMQGALASLDGKRVEGMTLSVDSVKAGGGEATVKFSVEGSKEFTDKLTEAVTEGAEKLLLGIVKGASPKNVELEIL